MTKITCWREVSIVVLTDDNGCLRSNNVLKLPRCQQIVLLSLIKPNVCGISGQAPSVGIQWDRTVIKPKTIINSINVLIVGNGFRGGEGRRSSNC